MQCINETFFEEDRIMEKENKEVLEFHSIQELRDFLNNCDDHTIISIVISKKEAVDEEL